MNTANMMTLNEVAQLANIHMETLRLWRRDDALAPREFKHGRRVFLSRPEVETWLANRLPR